MDHDHLYEPVPCSYWPEDLLHAVGTAYREARGWGEKGTVSLDQAEAAYIAAGGPATDARTMVLGMLASLSAERGDWLWGRRRSGWTGTPPRRAMPHNRSLDRLRCHLCRQPLAEATMRRPADPGRISPADMLLRLRGRDAGGRW